MKGAAGGLAAHEDEARKMYETGSKLAAIGARFGVHFSTVSHYAKTRKWKRPEKKVKPGQERGEFQVKTVGRDAKGVPVRRIA